MPTTTTITTLIPNTVRILSLQPIHWYTYTNSLSLVLVMRRYVPRNWDYSNLSLSLSLGRYSSLSGGFVMAPFVPMSSLSISYFFSKHKLTKGLLPPLAIEFVWLLLLLFDGRTQMFRLQLKFIVFQNQEVVGLSKWPKKSPI